MARSVTDSVVNVKRSLGRRGVDAWAGYCEIANQAVNDNAGPAADGGSASAELRWLLGSPGGMTHGRSLLAVSR